MSSHFFEQVEMRSYEYFHLLCKLQPALRRHEVSARKVHWRATMCRTSAVMQHYLNVL